MSNSKRYIGTKVIKAEPQERNGQAGYRVEYQDGYVSWSPKQTFEQAYREIGMGLTFGQMLEALKVGLKARRLGWNGNGIFITLQVPDKHSKMTQPYIYIDTLGLQTSNPNAPKGRVPWLASQTDMLAEDWEVLVE